MKKNSARALAAALLTAAPPAAATWGGDWPQWRGPARTGESAAQDLPVRWTATENVLWKLPLPGGSGSTPIVSGGQVFLNVADGPEIALWCVERTTGRVSWKQRSAVRGHPTRSTTCRPRPRSSAAAASSP
jgi:outer membrane protein assembly factor BamB